MFQAAFWAWVRGGLGFRQGFRRRSPDTQLATVTCSGSFPSRIAKDQSPQARSVWGSIENSP